VAHFGVLHVVLGGILAVQIPFYYMKYPFEQTAHWLFDTQAWQF